MLYFARTSNELLKGSTNTSRKVSNHFVRSLLQFGQVSTEGLGRALGVVSEEEGLLDVVPLLGVDTKSGDL